MTKEVLVGISGLQVELTEEVQDNEPLEVVAPGNYFLKNGKHYILYDEVIEGIPGEIKNKIKIHEDNRLEIIKSGITNAHMVFEEGKKNISYYQTPYGQMLIAVTARSVDVNITESRINVQVDYKLDVNEEPFANCTIGMRIVPKENATIALR